VSPSIRLEPTQLISLVGLDVRMMRPESVTSQRSHSVANGESVCRTPAADLWRMGRMLGEPIDFRPSRTTIRAAADEQQDQPDAGSLSTSHRLSQFLSCTSHNTSNSEKWQQIAHSLLCASFVPFSSFQPVPPSIDCAELLASRLI
jgi:hypothetical protein